MKALTRAALLFLCACATPPAPRSPGGATVVFEAGLGDGASVWDRVATPAGLGRLAWTRAGNGRGGFLSVQAWPGDADGRRSGAEVSDQLARRLSEAGVAPPYILVGHSLGALYVLDFARRHPDDVAGLVLVDPRLPGFTDLCKAQRLRGCEIPDLLRLTLSPAAQAEIAGLPETEAALRDLTALRDIPLTILVAQKQGLGEDPRWRGLWAQHAAAFASGFHSARVQGVATGHYIQKAAPEVVAAEIAALAP